MIQRLQSVYFLAIIIIGAVLCGGSIVNVHQDVNGVSTDYVLNIIYLMSTKIKPSLPKKWHSVCTNCTINPCYCLDYKSDIFIQKQSGTNQICTI
jgi:hypothetical protein